MRKNYFSSILLILTMMLASVSVYAQADRTIIFVGADEDAARAEDSVAIKEIQKWIANVIYLGQGAFNDSSASYLYTAAGINATGVVISESGGSTSYPNFALRDDYPVPVIIMENVCTGDPTADPAKWPILQPPPTGGNWGYGTPIAEDVQWKITENEHYITEGYAANQIINYAPEAGRGVPYLRGIDPSHTVLANGGRTAGDAGEDPPYSQDLAIGLAVIDNPSIVFMNVAYTYLAVGTDDFYKILKRSCEFLFGFGPAAVDQLATDEIELSIFPNPATSIASVSFTIEAGRSVSVNLFSVTGSIIGNVYEGISVAGKNLVKINTANYTPGIYFVELQIDNQITYSKLVVQ